MSNNLPSALVQSLKINRFKLTILNMNKVIPLLSILALLFFTNCGDSAAEKAAAEKAAAETKEAVMLDSISNELDKQKADIEADVQKLEESLKAIEE